MDIWDQDDVPVQVWPDSEGSRRYLRRVEQILLSIVNGTAPDVTVPSLYTLVLEYFHLVE